MIRDKFNKDMKGIKIGNIDINQTISVDDACFMTYV